MQILNTELSGVKILIFDSHEDARGMMEITMDESALEKAGISFSCKEQRVYHAPLKGTFYGIHFQHKNHPQEKIVHLLKGRGMDYVVDLQKDSPTYKKWVAIELRGGDNRHVYIPQGYGHAFISLEDDTMQIFATSEYFYKGESMKVRFDDPQIRLPIPTEITAISEADRNAPYLEELLSREMI